MSNSLFNLDELKRQLENLADLEKISTKVNELKELASEKYNDAMDNSVRKYDLNTQEGYENFIKEVSEIRKNLANNDSFFSSYLLKLLDGAVALVMEKHEAKKQEQKNQVQDIINKEVERSRKENNGRVNVNCECDCKCEHCDCEDDDNDFVWPSSLLSEKEKRSIWRIVDEYLDTMILPYCDEKTRDNDVMIDNISSGLFEFACWIMNKD